MASRNSTDWMWTQACALLDEAERMHRQFFRLGVSERTQAVWEPPVDVFEDDSDIVVVVALPRTSRRVRASRSTAASCCGCANRPGARNERTHR